MTHPAAAPGPLVPGAAWTSEGRTLTEADLTWSCMSSGDWHPIHADAEYAARTQVGQRMFHGTYGVHLAFGMATRFPPHGDAVIAALGFSDWKYRAPLFVGDTVRVHVRIQAVRPTSDGRRAVVERHIQLLRGDADVVQEGVASTLIRQESQA